MSYSEHGLLQVIDRVYASALGEEPWPGAVRAIRDHFHATGGWIFDLDRRSGQVHNWMPYGLEPTADEWVDHVKTIDPRLKFTFQNPPGGVEYDAMFISEREMDRHEFYDWQMRSAGTRYFFGSRLRDDGDWSTFMAFTFTPRHGPPSKAEVRSFSLLGKHVDNAWRLWNRYREASRDAGFPAFISEQIPWGVVTLDARGSVLAMNRRAREIVAARDGLCVARGLLLASRSAENRALSALIAAALKSSAGEPQHPGGTVQIPRKSGLPGYIVQVLPFVGSRNDHAPGAVLYISDPVAPHDLDRESLISAFKLTAREAELAMLLANGASLAQAADSLQISYFTARIHLQQAFRKTRTRNQAGLVRLLTRLIGSEPPAHS